MNRYSFAVLINHPQVRLRDGVFILCGAQKPIPGLGLISGCTCIYRKHFSEISLTVRITLLSTHFHLLKGLGEILWKGLKTISINLKKEFLSLKVSVERCLFGSLYHAFNVSSVKRHGTIRCSLVVRIFRH